MATHMLVVVSAKSRALLGHKLTQARRVGSPNSCTGELGQDTTQLLVVPRAKKPVGQMTTHILVLSRVKVFAGQMLLQMLPNKFITP
jgi:hypothetical protein